MPSKQLVFILRLIFVRYVNWIYTWNNPDIELGMVFPKSLVDSGDAVFCIHQLEKGESGTIHYQGYVEFEKKKTLAAVKKVLPEAHWEPRMGSQEEAIRYVTKEETRLSEPISAGERKKQPKVHVAADRRAFFVMLLCNEAIDDMF